MGRTWMEEFKANMAGNKAYRTHAQANRMSDTGKTEQAEAMYRLAMEKYIEAENLGCSKPNLLTGYSVLLMREGKYEKAKDLLVKISNDGRLNADDKFHLRINFAICQWRLGSRDKALDSMRQCVNYGKNTLVYTTMCSLLNEVARETGDFAEAEVFNKEAFDYDDEDAAILDNMARMYQFKSEHASGDEKKELIAKAKEYFGKALEENPRFPASLYSLAEITLSEGETSYAREKINKALEARFPSTCPVRREQAEEIKKKIG